MSATETRATLEVIICTKLFRTPANHGEINVINRTHKIQAPHINDVNQQTLSGHW